jgi:hypothetical protein
MKNVVMVSGLALTLVSYLALPSGMSAAPEEASAKCGTPPVLYLTDGRVQDVNQFGSIERNSIESLQVTCTDARHLIFGVEPGRQLILTWTKARPARELRSSMEAIASLQEAHFSKHGAYARTFAELGWEGSMKASLCVRDTGLRWTVLVANEKGGTKHVGGADSVGTSNARFSCDVRYPGAEEVLHWVTGEK